MHTLKETIEIAGFSLSKTADVIANNAILFQISPQGFYLKIHRKDLPKPLRSHLNLDSICNQDVEMYLPDMNLNVDGTVMKTRHVGKGVFEIFIKFLDTIPQYWCDCFLDALKCYPDGECTDFEFVPSSKKDLIP